MVDWALSSCCGDNPTIVFLVLYGVYTLMTYFLMEKAIAKPLKLIAIFIHEFSHASACWLTGGSVQKIEVYQNEGGVAHFSGGLRPCIVPAGYCGVSFWGGVFVALSGGRIPATVAGSLFCFALLICLCYSPNKLLVWLNLSFILITLIALLIDWFLFDPFIQYITLLYGTFIGWYGIMDIWDDTISRVVEESDAYACFKMWRCCLPRCVGVQFAILAILCQLAGIYFALVSLGGDRVT